MQALNHTENAWTIILQQTVTKTVSESFETHPNFNPKKRPHQAAFKLKNQNNISRNLLA